MQRIRPEIEEHTFEQCIAKKKKKNNCLRSSSSCYVKMREKKEKNANKEHVFPAVAWAKSQSYCSEISVELLSSMKISENTDNPTID
jgi:hypothetical protein